MGKDFSAVDMNERRPNLTSKPSIRCMHWRRFEEFAKSKLEEKQTQYKFVGRYRAELFNPHCKKKKGLGRLPLQDDMEMQL